MVANYFTLLHLTKSLSAGLSGLTLRASFSQQRSTLVVQAGREGLDEYLEISCDSSANYVLPRQNFTRARKNSVDVFPELIGSLISGVSLHPSDRQLSLLLESGERILIQVYGSAANVLWVSPTQLVRAAFLKSKSLVGTLLLESDKGPVRIPSSFEDLRTHDVGSPLQSVLKSALPQLGPLYTREALFRGGFTGQEMLAELSLTRQRTLLEALRSVLDELLAPVVPRLYERKEEAPLLSLCMLSHLEASEIRRPESLQEALAIRIAQQYRSKGLHDEKARILEQLDRALRRAEQALSKLDKEAVRALRADEYERFASLLMANLASISKGMTAVDLEDIFDVNRPSVHIPLERALNPAQNAERYFSKAKKARTAHSDAQKRKDSLEKELHQVRDLHSVIESAESREDLRSCVADHRNALKKFGISTSSSSSKSTEERVPFRVFVVAGGFTVWAGKSSQNNDLLTMKHARPNDLWFHARGSGGSHVVLKAGSGKGEISKRAIEEAASIAAYYSKMKNASTVPVAMTERKYVRKPKGAPPGTVTLEREKVLFVEPRLPEQPAKDQDE